MLPFICEHQNPVRPAEAFTLDQCRVCWLKFGGDPRGAAGTPVTQIPFPDCKHLGDLVPLRDRERLGLTLLRDWFTCQQGLGTNGYVCRCGGCSPLCPKYVASREDDS